MIKHRYRIGQIVDYRPPFTYGGVSPGRFTIERLLPSDGAGNQYRVASTADGHQRVVRENELSAG